MTKDEIKALIAAKIAGQGSAIDAASVLPTILDAIIDSIPLYEPSIRDFGNIPAGTAIHITTEEARELSQTDAIIVNGKRYKNNTGVLAAASDYMSFITENNLAAFFGTVIIADDRTLFECNGYLVTGDGDYYSLSFYEY